MVDVLVNIQDVYIVLLIINDFSFVPRQCGLGARLVIVTILLLLVEATAVSVCSTIVVHKLGEDSNRSCHTECKCLRSSATRQLVL